MNTELLRRILDDARDNAATLAQEDEIRVLMLDLGLSRDVRRPFATSGFVQSVPAPRKPRQARK